MKKMEKLKQNVTDYQLQGGKTYIKYESDGYSQYQNYLYKRALYGLDALKQEELARLKNEMAQYREAFDILRGRLQEVNLLNAKLLFTNKMFKKEGLSGEQKIRIVESFDRATTVREVKLVYTALVENLSTAAKTFTASRKKVVTEGFASKATPSTAPKAEVIVENTVAKRLQELAGII